jgi:hypothetical protein
MTIEGRPSERGLSLAEVTIVLLTMAALAAAIAPAIAGYLGDARAVKAKKDVDTIGAAIDGVMRDVGARCLSLSGSLCDRSDNGRVELLVSGVDVEAAEPAVTAAALAVPAGTASAASLNWAGGAGEVGAAHRDVMNHQLVANTPDGVPGDAYPSPALTGGRSYRASGWRGAYVAGPVGLDPWGRVYQASTVFLAVASDAAAGTGEGQAAGGWSHDVVVISAGADAAIQTPFGGPDTGGDDVVAIVQGSTR